MSSAPKIGFGSNRDVARSLAKGLLYFLIAGLLIVLALDLQNAAWAVSSWSLFRLCADTRCGGGPPLLLVCTNMLARPSRLRCMRIVPKSGLYCIRWWLLCHVVTFLLWQAT